MPTEDRTETADRSLELLPSSVSWPRLRRHLIVMAVILVAVAAVVAALPGLGDLREHFADAKPVWLLVAVLLQVGSCLSYVVVFRTVFCERMSWRTSYEIGMAELATNSLVSVGGAGGLALGAWILRRGGMPTEQVARRTVAFFLITSAANVTALIIAGAGLATGVLHGAPSPLLGLIPAGLAFAAVVIALGLGRGAQRLSRRLSQPKLASALEHVGAGVGEALLLLRRAAPGVILGAAGYMLFDVAMLGVCFAAFGADVPTAGVLLTAYLVGQLGGLIPLPGGIGGVDGGLIGALVLYGVPAAAAAAAVLAYRVIVLVLPVLLGVPALLVLQKRLHDEEVDVSVCAPGDEVEVLGRGRVRVADLRDAS